MPHSPRRFLGSSVAWQWVYKLWAHLMDGVEGSTYHQSTLVHSPTSQPHYRSDLEGMKSSSWWSGGFSPRWTDTPRNRGPTWWLKLWSKSRESWDLTPWVVNVQWTYKKGTPDSRWDLSLIEIASDPTRPISSSDNNLAATLHQSWKLAYLCYIFIYHAREQRFLARHIFFEPCVTGLEDYGSRQRSKKLEKSVKRKEIKKGGS